MAETKGERREKGRKEGKRKGKEGMEKERENLWTDGKE